VQRPRGAHDNAGDEKGKRLVQRVEGVERTVPTERTATREPVTIDSPTTDGARRKVGDDASAAQKLIWPHSQHEPMNPVMIMSRNITPRINTLGAAPCRSRILPRQHVDD